MVIKVRLNKCVNSFPTRYGVITFNSRDIRLVLYSCHMRVVNTMNPDIVTPAIVHRVSDHGNSEF